LLEKVVADLVEAISGLLLSEQSRTYTIFSQELFKVSDRTF